MDSKFVALLNKVKEYSKTQFEKEYRTGSWGKGLLLYGMIAKYLYDNDEDALEFARKLVDQSIETQTLEGELSGGDPSQVNFALIGLSVLFFANIESKTNIYREAVKKQADYFLDQPLKRTDSGAIYYLKDSPQVWVDTLIMVCPFLAWAGKFLDNSRYIAEAVKQLLLHIECLKDPETGLYRHIWDDEKKSFYEGSLWGRGNGWVITSLVEVAEQLPKDHPDQERLIIEIQQLVEKLILCQDEHGYWRFFLDDFSEKSKVETAGTLIIAYGLSKAIRNEWIDIRLYEYVQNAFDAVITCVDEDGKVTNASGPTVDPKHTPYNKPYAHAQGFFLITAYEVMQLIQFLKEKQVL